MTGPWPARWSLELILRVPSARLDMKVARRYCTVRTGGSRSESSVATTAGVNLVSDLWPEDESGDDREDAEAGLLSALVTVRNELMAGDYRALTPAPPRCNRRPRPAGEPPAVSSFSDPQNRPKLACGLSLLPRMDLTRRVPCRRAAPSPSPRRSDFFHCDTQHDRDAQGTAIAMISDRDSRSRGAFRT
jgi:hypothetical protein